MSNNFRSAIQSVRLILRPPLKQKMSEFAELEFKLSPESSAEPGAYSTSRFAPQREMLDVAGDPTVRDVVFCTSSQVGKTTVLMIALFNYIKNDPSPILLVMPTVSLAQSFSKDRLTPALRDSPSIGALLPEAKSRDGNNTILSKTFPGGSLNIVGSNSPSELASRPVRVLLCDEIDRWPADVGGEGSPLALAERRTATFYNAKKIFVSTPTDKETSVIWSRYEASDQRKYNLSCVHCESLFDPKWADVKWEKAQTGEHLPHTALLYCPHCGGGHTDAQRNAAVRNGEWIKTYPDRPVAGFQLSAIHSPFAILKDLATEFLACQHDHARLKTFINTLLGEPYESQADSADDIPLMSRVQEYDEQSIPNDVSILTAGADTQKDRMEVTVMGHGKDNEKWIISHTSFMGNPDSTDVLEHVKDHLLKIHKREDGTLMRIQASIIDSGGLSTQRIYDFCKANTQYRIMAGKGAAGNRPIFPKKITSTDLGKVYILGVDAAKEQIYEQLRVETCGPQYVHFSHSLTPTYFEQLTSEKREIKRRNGYTFYQWVLPKGRNNEALDCAVYALAAYEAMGVKPEIAEKRLQARQAKLAQLSAQSEPTPAPTPEPTPAPQPAATPIPAPSPRRVAIIRPQPRQSAWI